MTSTLTGEATSTLTSTSDSDSDSSSSESSTGMVVVGCDALALVDDPPAICSVQASSSATFRIVNDCETETLEVFWVNYACVEDDYALILPGQDWQINSYDTHPWRIRATSDGRLMVEVPPLDGNTTVVVP
jgi:hypothetical protein